MGGGECARQEDDREGVTVKELCRLFMISRSTFYALDPSIMERAGVAFRLPLPSRPLRINPKRFRRWLDSLGKKSGG